MATGTMVVVENLRGRMFEKQAGLTALAKRAGVDRRTVYLCRKGRPVRTFTAECIEQALERFSFGWRSEAQRNIAMRFSEGM